MYFSISQTKQPSAKLLEKNHFPNTLMGNYSITKIDPMSEFKKEKIKVSALKKAYLAAKAKKK